ncbi:MAG: DNA polymerase Y family protein [Microbacteriaceae bacterium]
MSSLTRTMVLWIPDWPVTAVQREHDLPVDAAIAVVDRSIVFACSPAARLEGVRRGQRMREAQARCAELLVIPYEPHVDSRAFEPLIDAVEALAPGVQLLRPGTVAVRSRGPAAYYGGERPAALALITRLSELGVSDARAGIADGPFAAEQAARQQSAVVRVVAEGGSAEFLAPLPVSILGEPSLAVLLRRLGIHTVGQFSDLPSLDVRDRFGDSGSWAHTLASGHDERTVQPRTPPPHLEQSIDFEPALERVDQVAFGVLSIADDFIAGLVANFLVCTAIHVEVEAERGELSVRSWLHPRSFTAAEVVDRVRWQLQGSNHIDSGLGSGIVRVRISPESVDAIGNHESGLWGSGPDERVHHGLSRVQSMLGHESVVTAGITGGRALADRVSFIAWGDRPDPSRVARTATVIRPWPGQLPTPAPATVFASAHSVHVFAADGTQILVDDRGQLSGSPAQFSAATGGSALRTVTAWAGPWPIDQRWWDATAYLRANRFQLVDSEGSAWLLSCITEKDGSQNWVAEARYD